MRIDNDPVALALALAEAGPNPDVAIEATYGWYWAVDVLQAEGAKVHLVHPSGLNWEDRRVKNDYRDCQELLARMRLNKLPEAWIAPPAVRELREMVRYRAKLVALRSGLKAQVKAVLAKHGLHPPVNDLWGLSGTAYLNELELADGYWVKVESLRDLVEHYDRDVAMFERRINAWLRDDAGYAAIQAISGVGPVLGPSSWPRSATSVASPRPSTCARGPGSRQSTGSPTSKSIEARSPRRDRPWCAGPP